MEDGLPTQMDSDKWVDKIPVWSSQVSLVLCSQTMMCGALSLAVYAPTQSGAYYTASNKALHVS